MDRQHNLRGFLSVHAEELLQNVHDKLHRRVVIVQQNHFVHRWTLKLWFRFQRHNAGVAVTTRGDRSKVMERMEIASFAEPTAEGLAEAMYDLAADPEQRALLSKRVADWSARRSWAAAGAAYASLLTGNPDHVEVI